MKWHKSGMIFKPDNEFDWMASHANFPTPLLMKDRIRLYFSPRSRQGQSTIAVCDVDRTNPSQLIEVYDAPALLPGKTGTFDDCGIQPNCAIQRDDEVWLYYLGWNPAVNQLSRNSTGIAVSVDGGLTFERMFEGPVLDRSAHEPYFCYTPWLLKDDRMWHCWYGSGTAWVPVNGKPEGLFHTKYCSSLDGIHFIRNNHSCIHPADPMEVNCRPSVIKQGDIFRMWYSVRKAEDFRGGDNSYRVGYAESSDGLNWMRMDNRVGIAPSEQSDDFDSQMLCMASVLEVDGCVHMFYAGNGFGLTGMGHAVLEE